MSFVMDNWRWFAAAAVAIALYAWWTGRLEWLTSNGEAPETSNTVSMVGTDANVSAPSNTVSIMPNAAASIAASLPVPAVTVDMIGGMSV